MEEFLTSCGGPDRTHSGTPVSFKVKIIPAEKTSVAPGLRKTNLTVQFIATFTLQENCVYCYKTKKEQFCLSNVAALSQTRITDNDFIRKVLLT